MKNNPDDRSNNVERIQKNINHTIENIRLADEMIEKTSDEKTRRDLARKNEWREESLEGLREEIRDEAEHRKNQRKEDWEPAQTDTKE